MAKNISNIQSKLIQLAQQLSGELHIDQKNKTLYATDASVYRAIPLAVALPKINQDIKQLIQFAQAYQTALIPRGAGTSLAGQVVGEAIVVDVSKYMNQILEFNPQEKWIWVQPGVVRDELNAFLKPHGLFFSPITSTANRATIGGMVGNNSSGTTSIVYGTTREHVLELETYLSDGSLVNFRELTKAEFESKTQLKSLEGVIYQQFQRELSQEKIQESIRTKFPKPSIHRRNTGYAVDALLETAVFSDKTTPFNVCKLLCGSEGTLAFTTAIKLHLDDLQPPYDVMVAVHFSDLLESLKATQLAMQFAPSQCEMMDKIILDCTKENIQQRKNRWFLEGDPAALLMVEFRGDTLAETEEKASVMIAALQAKNMGYAYPIIPPERTQQLRDLRKAGLGVLSNLAGDKKAVTCIEDTAVALEDLDAYIEEVGALMANFGQQLVVYAHAGAGELHLRPILNLKTSKGVQQFYGISAGVAKIVKQYQGSLSGEHGDGRLRGGFIPEMVGADNYELFKRIKYTWDPKAIFNPNKIVDTPPMTESLRYQPDQKTKTFSTIFDFSKTQGILRAAEQCNGSGDCRKLPLSGGTMCPSYQATRNEQDTTRARANILREFLTQSEQENPFNQEEIKAVMDLCLSCKGCTSECPSNVDMATLKAEFLYQYYQANPIPWRARAFASINTWNELGGKWPAFYNFLLSNPLLSTIAKKILRIAPKRQLPKIHQLSLRQWYHKNYSSKPAKHGTVVLFCDEFTNWNDTTIGIKTIQLLQALGYEVKLVAHPESGRAAISKGLLKKAQAFANENVKIFQELINKDTPLIGIEPSAILSFQDEYPRLVAPELKAAAQHLAQHTYTIESFLYKAVQKEQIQANQFTTASKTLLVHGHCHQKSLTNWKESLWLLAVPQNYQVQEIPSGCCGMAGSFGYEKEHYAVSQQIGALVLFPAVRAVTEDVIIVAAGTSCRHQILEGTERQAWHPVEVLWEALV